MLKKSIAARAIMKKSNTTIKNRKIDRESVVLISTLMASKSRQTGTGTSFSNDVLPKGPPEFLRRGSCGPIVAV
jgi:hypothetical protein